MKARKVMYRVFIGIVLVLAAGAAAMIGVTIDMFQRIG
jgi:hypothetical protein